MTTYQENNELLEEITQEEIPNMEARATELIELYNSTNDPDLRQIITSDLFIEFGTKVES